MAWSELDAKVDTTSQDNAKAVMDALAQACTRAIVKDGQGPLKAFLMDKAHSISYRPGIPAEEVAFREGQRSLALQLLKLAGESK